MSEGRIRRIGQNEALYRQVNEQVRGINEGVQQLTGSDFGILCECGLLECAQQIEVPRTLYEETRASSYRFFVVRGHEIEDTEDVVEDHGAFVVVEKRPPEARELAEEMDPRS